MRLLPTDAIPAQPNMTARVDALTDLVDSGPLRLALGFLLVAAVTAAAVVAVTAAERGPVPPFVDGQTRGPAPRAEPRPTGVLWLAGSGSNLPLTRALARDFEQTRRGVRIVVHESLGTAGGARAVAAGAIDLGLASRSLTAAERAAGLVSTPYARVAVVVAASPTVNDAAVTRDELVAIFAGRRTRWSDGASILPVQRERGDSSHFVVAAALPAFADADDRTRRAGRFRVAYSDRELQDALLTTEGAVGLFDRGAIVAQRLPLRMLTIDGVAPTPENTASGAYPFVKDLFFVTRGPPAGLAAVFVAFATSPAGQAAVRASGYEPLRSVAGAVVP